ncbi:hypothetical protein tb265_42070 [Gemmatimonadetes bacterium T265]|nr:hypothetical protein tb265_42070 [Gemmatimonadetes bacterium T265]
MSSAPPRALSAPRARVDSSVAPAPVTPAAADARAVLDALRAVTRELRLAERDPDGRPGLPPAQLHALRELAARPARSLAELAERTHTDPSSASVVVQRLVARGLVTRVEADGDRRRTELKVTASGRTLAARAPASALARVTDALESLGARQTAALARNLHVLARGLRAGQPGE